MSRKKAQKAQNVFLSFGAPSFVVFIFVLFVPFCG